MTGIISLYTENVKRLSAVRIKPDGQPVVIIGGNNGSGKTSTIDSIEMALRGGKSIPDKPVRNGQDGAEIILETGELIVHRKIKPDGSSTVTVSNKEGARFSSPQAMLDKLVGSLSFDPLEFTRMKPKQQEETLRELLGIDTRKLDAQREMAFQDRTVVNREVKSLEAQLAGMSLHAEVPEEELSAQEIQESLQAAQEHNRKVKALDDVFVAKQQAVVDLEAERDEVVSEIERLMAELKSANVRKIQLGRAITVAAQEAEISRLAAQEVQPIDESEIVETLVSVADTNRKIAENESYRKRAAELDAKRQESAALTATIEAIDQAKREMLEGAEYPIPELSIHPENGVYLNGNPLSQASGAEGLRASMAIAIAMNPGFPVALIRDGSLLDANSLAMVEQMAAEKGCQIWMERVGEGEEGSVIIAEGAVKSSRLNGHKAEAVAK